MSLKDITVVPQKTQLNFRIPKEGYDLIWKKYDGSEIKIECKTYRNYPRISIIPSKMRGVGRKFDNEQLKEWLKKTDAFMFLNIETFPIIPVTVIPIGEVVSNMRLTKTQCDLTRSFISYGFNSDQIDRLIQQLQ